MMKMTEIIIIKPNHQLIDLTNKQFGRLTVVALFGKKSDEWAWLCFCNCGGQKVILGTHLRSGKTRSCGCLSAEIAGARQRTHGMTYTSEFTTWQTCKARCYNPKNHKYKNYGARGIKMCQKWMESFAAFFHDMGNKPSPKHSIHRINNDGDYEPGNCKWATYKEQARNRTNNRFIEVGGERITVAEFAERNNIDQRIIHSRLNKGCPVSELLKPRMSARATGKGHQ